MIFLHSSFRTSSTWLWAKFREQKIFISYYEVFNQVLAAITAEIANAHDYNDWDSRHPQTPPYFLEFIPLLKEAGGVEGYSTEMSYHRFIPESGIGGDISQAEEAYLDSLIKHGEKLGKIPVLSATRSLGRVPGLRRALGGTHILIYRNPFHQWCSYSEQFLRQNFSFVESIRDTILLSQHDLLLSDLCRTLGIESGEIDNNKLLIAFVVLHLYLYAQSAGSFDILIDVGRLATEENYHQAIEAEIGEKCGVRLDLSDARLSLGANLTLLGSRKEIEAVLDPWVARIVAGAPSEIGRALVLKGYMDFLNEYERHFFYVLPIVRSWKPIVSAWEIGKSLRDDEIACLTKECEGMKNSLSWRLTAPLRLAGALFTSKDKA